MKKNVSMRRVHKEEAEKDCKEKVEMECKEAKEECEKECMNTFMIHFLLLDTE